MAVGVAGAPRGEDPRATARKVAKEAMAKVGTDKAPSYYYMVASVSYTHLIKYIINIVITKSIILQNITLTCSFIPFKILSIILSM